MAVGVIFMGKGVTKAQYDQVNDAVNPSNRLIPGMISHAAGMMTDDTFCVTEVWESQEAMDRFVREHLVAEMQKANITTMPMTFQVTNLLTK